jgi:EamA domain-containing membrane protein RarD
VLATFFFLLYSFLYTANLVSAGFLYRTNPGLGSFQLLYGRSIVATVSIVVWLRSDLKRVTYDEVVGVHDKELTFRSLQSAWSNMIKTAASKYISLLMISVIANLGPPITVVMAFFWLNESVNGFEAVLMFLQMCCAMIVVFGA